MKIRITGLWVALGLIITIAPGLLPIDNAQAQENDGLNVVASTSILADVARQIGGESVTVTSLVPLGGDVHTFQPVPSDIVGISEADIVLVNGAGLEEWLDDLIAENATLTPIVVSTGVTMLALSDEYGHHDDMDDEHMDDEHMDDEHMDDEHMDGMGMGSMGTTSAAYMQITNNGDTDVTLNSANATFANLVEIHETSIVDDVAQMREVGMITIPAGETVTLQPGGLHIMLMGITQDLLIDDTATVTIGFDDGTSTELIAPITDIPPETPQTLEVGDLTIRGFWVRPAAAMQPMDGMDAAMDDMDAAMDGMDAAMDGHYIGRLGEVDCDTIMDADHMDDDHMDDDHMDDEHMDDEHMDDEHMDDDHMDDEHDHAHGACDPHVWTDPTNVMIWADNIADVFADADPSNADAYRANAEAYKVQLMDIDMQIMARLNDIPAENRIIVTNHDFLGYFAERYGFEIVGVVLSGGTTLAETSPQAMAMLVEVIRAEGVNTIFAEVSSPDDVATAIASEVGTEIQIIKLYSGALDETVPTYLDYLQYNLDAIAGALGG